MVEKQSPRERHLAEERQPCLLSVLGLQGQGKEEKPPMRPEEGDVQGKHVGRASQRVTGVLNVPSNSVICMNTYLDMKVRSLGNPSGPAFQEDDRVSLRCWDGEDPGTEGAHGSRPR